MASGTVCSGFQNLSPFRRVLKTITNTNRKAFEETIVIAVFAPNYCTRLASADYPIFENLSNRMAVQLSV